MAVSTVKVGGRKEPQAALARTVFRGNGTTEVWISLPRNRFTKWAKARYKDYIDIAKKNNANAVFVEYPSLFTGKLVKKLVYGKVDWIIDENGEMQWL